MPHKHLTFSEREVISQLLSSGWTQAAIARELGRSASTISRELSRNWYHRVHSSGVEISAYRPEAAQQQAEARRRHRPLQRKLDKGVLGDYVDEKLRDRWSPQQISGRLRAGHDGRGNLRVSHETIYAWIRKNAAKDPQLQTYLRRRGRRYRRHGRSFRDRFPNRRKIEDRSVVVNDRRRRGDWEGDTVHGRGRSGFIATYVDRKSGYLLAGKLPKLDSAQLTVCSAKLFRRLSGNRRLTLTLDNGVEFADHLRLERLTGLQIYFARPYCSTDRATNENTNGLLRDYFPKTMDFRTLTHQQLAKAVHALNHRPRKRLNYKTPHEVFHK